MRHRLITGYNIDAVNVQRGLDCLIQLGYTDSPTLTVIKHCLMRWARGEEENAQRMAIDSTFYGIDLTSWTLVLASAIGLPHCQTLESRQL